MARNGWGSIPRSQSATTPAANSSDEQAPRSKRRTQRQLSQWAQTSSSSARPLRMRIASTPPWSTSTPPRSKRTTSMGSAPAIPAMLRAMKISMTLNYTGGYEQAARQVAELEKVGLDVVWVAEAYSFDAPTFMGYLAAKTERVEIGRAILPIYTRPPTARPLTRTRKIVDVCRKVWAREAPLTHDGPAYHIPLPEGQGTGLGKALKIINHPVRPNIPIWVAALGEKNVAMTAEVADGWLPIFFMPEKAKDVFGPSLAEGAAKRDPALG